MNFWDFYIILYSILAFSYLIYRYAFVLSNDENNLGNYRGRATLIVPFYNEDPDLLERTIRSANDCLGKKEIIIVDDGSDNKECYNRMLELKKEIPFKLIRYEKNKGKRNAQVIGFKKAKGDIIITLDSDTLLHKEALLNLMKPFSDPEVGATTGQLEVLNNDENLLTKMQSARYWNAFNFERQAQSCLGVVVCCSGPISAYRKSTIDKIADEFLGQEFNGRKCTYGDDRHLTTLILKNGYKVFYVKEAKGYTEVPSTFRKFWKQQVRWRKSWLRETYLVSKFMFKRSKALTFEILITTFLPFFSILARATLLLSLIFNPIGFLSIIPLMLAIITLHSTYMIFHKPRLLLYNIIYGIIYVFVFYWTLIHAIIEFRNNAWGTR